MGIIFHNVTDGNPERRRAAERPSHLLQGVGRGLLNSTPFLYNNHKSVVCRLKVVPGTGYPHRASGVYFPVYFSSFRRSSHDMDRSKISSWPCLMEKNGQVIWYLRRDAHHSCLRTGRANLRGYACQRLPGK